MLGRIIGTILGFIAFLVGITVVFGSWYTIDAGERGVLLRNGAVIGTAGPGLGFKTPWIEEVIRISVQEHAQVYENVETYSRDQQPATLRLSVNYRIPEGEVEHIYKNYGSMDNLVSRILDRRVFEMTKTIFGQFNAVTSIQERARLNMEVGDAIQKAVNESIVITGVQIEDITFSPAYEASIEERMLAEVEVQKLKQNAEREKVQAEIKVIQATAEADAVREQAMAHAETIEMRGNAEAKAIEARGEALRNNPSLVSLVQAERWDGTLPTTMLPNGTVPFLDVGR